MYTILNTEPVRHLDNDSLTAMTINRMKDLSARSVASPHLREVVWELGCQNTSDGVVRAKLVFDWIRRNMRFVQDYVLGHKWLGDWDRAMDCEVLVSPDLMVTMDRMEGDCDDFAMMGMALLSICDVAAVFVTIKGDPRFHDEWSHVYLECMLGGKWIPFDASYGRYLGWETDTYWQKHRWE